MFNKRYCPARWIWRNVECRFIQYVVVIKELGAEVFRKIGPATIL